MNARDGIAQELAEIELGLRELEIRYEQYFAGVEKREPVKDREELARRLRRLANRQITQTDLRFRYQNLATRFHSYAGNWDRILRLIEEGRYHRTKSGKVHHAPAPAAPSTDSAATPPGKAPANRPANPEIDSVYRELIAAHRAGNGEGPAPDRDKLAAFLDQQREKIREKFGDREVVFRVELENGKPKIKVRAKQ